MSSKGTWDNSMLKAPNFQVNSKRKDIGKSCMFEQTMINEIGSLSVTSLSVNFNLSLTLVDVKLVLLGHVGLPQFFTPAMCSGKEVST